MSEPQQFREPRLTSLAHGGGCGCKLAPGALAEILGKTALALPGANFLVDASTSDDAAVYRVSVDLAIVATTDFFTPVVDDPYEFGRIAATNALSDVYAMGGTPIFSLAIVGMPIGKLSVGTIQRILEGGREVAEAAGAPIAGGHSIDAAEPIYGLVALGTVRPDRVLTNAGARAGDVLILGKPLGIGVFSAALKREILNAADYAAMIASTTLLNRPGSALAAIPGVHALTDVTGFGLLGHLSEICRASGVSAEIAWEGTPVFAGAQRLAADGVKTGASARNWSSVMGMTSLPAGASEAMRDLLCDPQTSGGLLVACRQEAAELALSAFHAEGHVEATIIGRIRPGPPSIRVV
jgi:selenide,water dikinase